MLPKKKKRTQKKNKNVSAVCLDTSLLYKLLFLSCFSFLSLFIVCKKKKQFVVVFSWSGGECHFYSAAPKIYRKGGEEERRKVSVLCKKNFCDFISMDKYCRYKYYDNYPCDLYNLLLILYCLLLKIIIIVR